MKKLKISMFIYSIMFIFLTIFRIIQLNTAIDSITGFSESVFFDVVLYGFLSLFFVFLFIYIYFDKNNKIENIVIPTKSIYFIYVIYGAILLYTYITNISNLIDEYKYSTENTSTLLIYIFRIITAVIGVLTGFSLFLEVFKKAHNKDNHAISFPSCFLIIVHATLSLLTYFIKERTVVTISQNLLTLLFWIFAVEFVFAFSRYLFNSKIGKPLKETVIFSILTSVLGAIIIVASIFAKEQIYYSALDSERIATIPIFLLSTSVNIANILYVTKK